MAVDGIAHADSAAGGGAGKASLAEQAAAAANGDGGDASPSAGAPVEDGTAAGAAAAAAAAESGSSSATPATMGPKPVVKQVGALRIMTWNVNGLRAALKKNFNETIAAEDPDIVCLSEVKAEPQQLKTLKVDKAYKMYWNPSKAKKGYAGTALFTKVAPIRVTFGVGNHPAVLGKKDASSASSTPQHDLNNEGRTITAEFDDFFLISSYVPNAGQKLKRHEYRTTVWDPAMSEYLRALDAIKPVVWTGDLNVAHEDIDIHNPKGNKKTAGFTPEERANFSKLLKQGFVDVFRKLFPTERQYTYWSYRFLARAKNKGWRLDYFVASERFLERVSACFVHAGIEGSDHCPIVMDVTGVEPRSAVSFFQQG